MVLNKLENIAQCAANVQTLEEQQLSQRDRVDPDAVDVLEASLIPGFGILLCVLL